MSGTNPSGGTFPELPEAPPSHVVGQGYSASHPIPTIQAYRTEKTQQEEQAQQYADLVERHHQETETRESQRDQSQAPPNGDVGETKQVAGEETNAAKTQMDKTEKSSANTGATEKDRLMDQMTANQRELAHGFVI